MQTQRYNTKHYPNIDMYEAHGTLAFTQNTLTLKQRVGEVRAGTTSPMPDHKGFKLQ